jgi:DHA1 family bicyclomycin/chloramphenicol resistance-like MFS transporter
MIFGIAPAIAPVIGGWLESRFGWRSVFVFLACYAVIMLAVSWRFLPETHRPAARHPFAPGPLAASYLKLSRSPRLMLLCIVVALNFSGGFLYVASAPAVIYDLLRLGESEFGFLFGPGIAGIIFGAYLSRRTAGRISTHRTVGIAYAIMFAAAGFNVIYHALAPPAVLWTVLPFMVYGTGMALAMPSLTLLAFDLFPAHRGLTSSLQGFVHSAGSAMTSGIIAPLLYGHGATLALGMLAFVTSGWLAWRVYLRLEAFQAQGKTYA